jgi:recombinational DNA repair protein (RecF pathway)
MIWTCAQCGQRTDPEGRHLDTDKVACANTRPLTPEEISAFFADKTLEWHRTPENYQAQFSLQEYLGMTSDEYRYWVKADEISDRLVRIWEGQIYAWRIREEKKDAQ